MPTPLPTPTPTLQRELVSLAWPIVVSRSTQTVVGVCDAWMVAHLGAAALAATTTGAMNTFTFLILPMGICFIVASYASQLTGAGDGAGARRYGWYGLGIALTAQLLCLAGMAWIGDVLGAFDYEPAVRQQMADYMTLRLLGGGAAVGLEALASYYSGIGQTKVPMRANLLAMVLNIGVNWLLIDGHLGLPALGVRGAAIASALASWCAFAYLFARFVRDGRAKALRKLTRVAVAHLPALPGLVGLSWREFGRMLRFGLPSGFNWFFEFLAFMFFVNIVVGGLGTSALAAFMAVLQINSVSFMPAFGLASAGAILVGQRIGAGLRDAVPRIVRQTFITTAIWQSSVGLAYLTMPDLLFAPFAAGDPVEAAALAKLGSKMLLMSSMWQLFDSATAVLSEALRAAGDTAFPLYARLAVSWLLFAPGSWYCVTKLGWGPEGALMWVVGYLGVLAVVLYGRFRSGAWRSIELVENP